MFAEKEVYFQTIQRIMFYKYFRHSAYAPLLPARRSFDLRCWNSDFPDSSLISLKILVHVFKWVILIVTSFCSIIERLHNTMKRSMSVLRRTEIGLLICCFSSTLDRYYVRSNQNLFLRVKRSYPRNDDLFQTLSLKDFSI